MEHVHTEEKIPFEPQIQYVNYYYGRKDNQVKADSDVCARTVVSNLKDGHPLNYVKQFSGEFFDPNETSFTYRKRLWKMRKVGDLAFRLYLLFLGHPDKTTQGKKQFKFKAEREQ